MSDVMEPLVERLRELLNEGVTQESAANCGKRIRDAIDTELDSFEWSLKDNLAYNLAAHVQDMAERAVKAMLDGNDDEMRRYLSCQSSTWSGREHAHRVYNGKLFEPSAIELRRKIVNEHADLLKTERILDLEAQLTALTQQIVTLERQKEELRQFIRDGRPQ